jgi:KaiC/GvpD/RAD55 family RecA-like ATPase
MTAIGNLIKIKKANELMADSRKEPTPGFLIDGLWRDGEMMLLVGESGSGKSALAVQMAEAILRRGKIGPFEATAKPGEIVYIDLEHTAKQFEERYLEDDDPERPKRRRKAYRFSDKLTYVSIDTHADNQDGIDSFDTELSKEIEQLIKDRQPKAVIIDSLTVLKRWSGETQGGVELIRELSRMTRRFGVSILVLASISRRFKTRRMDERDLSGVRVAANYADSVVAVGSSRSTIDGRYLKQIKQRSGTPMCAGSVVAAFTIGKINDSFLGFTFEKFAYEEDLLKGTSDEGYRINEANKLYQSGLSIRETARQMGLSRTTVHTYLRMAGNETVSLRYRNERLHHAAFDSRHSREALPEPEPVSVADAIEDEDEWWKAEDDDENVSDEAAVNDLISRARD